VRWAYIAGVLLMLYYLAAIFEHDSQTLSILDYTIKAIVFTGLLLVFIPKDSPIRFSETNVFTRLGKISYGLYVYHIVWIHVVYQYFINHQIELNHFSSYAIFTTITLAATIVTAIASYR